MATGSARKKINKRLNLNSSSKRHQPSMAATPTSAFRFNYIKILLMASFALISCVIVLLSISSSSRGAFESKAESSPLYTVEVVNEFPHDPKAFTQGLLYAENDILFESTGLHGRSSVRRVALLSGEVQALQKMKTKYFGEGLTLLGERLFQVTWLQNAGFIYDRNNLSKFESFTHGMPDGWGLATDGKFLFGSDGTSTLYQIDPKTFKVTAKQTVTYKGYEVHYLNELEYINGEVWANVWQTDCIARISPKDGTVIGWVLLQNLREGLLASGAWGIDVLNGIAWDKDQDRLFVTGKLWPKLYEIKLHQMKKTFSGDVEQICIPPRFSQE